MAFDVGAIVGRLELDKKKWEQSIEAVKKDQTSLQGFVLRNEQQIKKFGQAFTIAGAAITGMFGLLVKKTVDAGDHINDLSKRTGIGTETLSAYSLAADSSGTSLDGLAIGLKGLATNMGQANSGSREAKQLFDQLGVAYKDNTGNLRSLNDVMLDVADQFMNMQDGEEKLALATKLFGRSGMELIPMLNMGRKGLEEYMRKARDLGMIWLPKAAQEADEFNDAVEKLKGGTAGLGRQVVTGFLPVIKNLIDKTTTVTIKIREWVKEHPGLATGMTKAALGMGLLFTAIGPVLMALPGLIKGLQAIKILAAKEIVFTFAVAGVAIVSTAVYKMIEDFKILKTQGETTFESLKTVLLKLNPFATMSREHIKKIFDEIDKGKKPIETLGLTAIPAARNIERLISPLKDLNALLGKLGIKTRTELTAELNEATKALGLLRKSTEATPGSIQQLEKKIQDIRDQLRGYTTAIGETGVAMSTHFPAITALVIALWKSYVDYIKLPITETIIPQFNKRALLMERTWILVKGGITSANSLIQGSFAALAKSIWGSKEEIMRFADNIMRAMLGLRGIYVPFREGLAAGAKEVATKMDEISTIVADAMRDIARAFVGLFNFKKLFGAMTIDIKFDSSAFDGMAKAANRAYDQITDASRKAFDAQELQISRAEEDEDIRYRHEYDNKRKAIEDSNRTQKQKDALLKALELQYENAKLARERAREDAKYLREEIQAKKLLQLQWDHEADLDKIRKAENLARDKQAQDELDRQNSLWFKVKGIFATACENMATIFLTKMFEPVGNLIGKLAGKLIGKGADTVGGALDGVGGKVGNLGKTIGDFISGIGKGIGGFISGLATGIATAITTLATAIASAATILAAAIVPLAIIGAFAVSLYYAFKLVDVVMGKLAGGGKTSDITYWLKLIWENTTNLLNWTIGGITAQLEAYVKAPMVEKFDALKASLDLTRDQMIPRLDKIVEYTSFLKNIKFGQHGLDTTVSRPTMFMAGERGPERVTISPNFRISSAPIYVNVNIDGKLAATQVFRYAPELSRDGALKIHERALIRN